MGDTAVRLPAAEPAACMQHMSAVVASVRVGQSIAARRLPREESAEIAVRQWYGRSRRDATGAAVFDAPQAAAAARTYADHTIEKSPS